MSKMLYISNDNYRLGYTPENDYDPRYYDLASWREYDDGYYGEILNTLNDRFGSSSYQLISYDDVVYTENYDVMRVMQDEFGITPMWFDVTGDDVGTVDELEGDGWEW